MTYGTPPLPENRDFPALGVYVPEVGIVAVQGGSPSTDSQGYEYAPLIAAPSAKSGAVSLSSPPTNTNAGSDTTLTFTSQVNHILIQNNTAANCSVEFDATASTASPVLVPGTIWEKDIEVTSPHLYTAAAQPINAANGIIIRGWL